MKFNIVALLIFCGIIGIAGCGGRDKAANSAGVGENGSTLVSDSAPSNVEGLSLTQGEPGAATIIDAGRYTDAARPPGAPPANGATADGTLNSYYTPGKAFDGNFNTWWVGTSGRGQWDLYYGFATSTRVDQISVSFYNVSYVPATIVLKTSVDGTTWTTVGTMPAANANPYINVNANIRYYWIQMDGNPAMGFPLVRDVKCLPNLAISGSTGGPGFDDARHSVANAFDGNDSTGWAGAVNAGKWDLYYRYASPQTIQTLTATMFNMNYKPATMTLYTSVDASTWTEIGKLGPGASPAIYVGANVTYLHLEMTGNPISNFPYIKDISYTQPSGASSGDERSGFYKASNAFDGDANTLWVGDSAKSEWNLFMNYPAAKYTQSISIAYAAANAIPATTSLFCSSDAISWTLSGTFARTATPTLAINTSCKYLRFKMTKSGAYPAGGYPVIKDITTVSSVCGNSTIEPGETCEDGNAVSGDGCSSACQNDAKDTNAWITIPAGNFYMGCASGDPECRPNEVPKRTITLSQYKIQKYEVTNAQYKACVTAGACAAPASANSKTRTPYYGNAAYNNYPMVDVTWSMASVYCAWLGGRLPTEAEWEKAARGPYPRQTIYPWGNTLDCSKANYTRYSDAFACVGDTTPVGNYPDNYSYYGVMDMSGNAWEWVNDWYNGSYYSSMPATDPQGPPADFFRVLRGGGFYDDEATTRSSHRNINQPTRGDYGSGVRCAHN